jgi:hypothetical protein
MRNQHRMHNRFLLCTEQLVSSLQSNGKQLRVRFDRNDSLSQATEHRVFQYTLFMHQTYFFIIFFSYKRTVYYLFYLPSSYLSGLVNYWPVVSNVSTVLDVVTNNQLTATTQTFASDKWNNYNAAIGVRATRYKNNYRFLNNK